MSKEAYIVWKKIADILYLSSKLKLQLVYLKENIK